MGGVKNSICMRNEKRRIRAILRISCFNDFRIYRIILDISFFSQFIEVTFRDIMVGQDRILSQIYTNSDSIRQSNRKRKRSPYSPL